MLPTSDVVRQPRIRALANGELLDRTLEVDILSNSHRGADRFRIAVAHPPAALLDFGQISLEVQLSLAPGEWVSLIQGDVDTVEHDVLANRLDLHGRDFASRLVEARTQETFANQTSSEIVATVAARHGLAADAMLTTTPVGRYWQLEHDRVTLDHFSRTTTEWDLLSTLADHEGFDLWVEGKTLRFQPRMQDAQPSTVLRPVNTQAGTANVTSLRLERSLTLARDIEVTVKSWNSRQQAAFQQTARKAGSFNGGSGSGPPLRYSFVVPNLTPEDALKLARLRLAEFSAHERVIVAEMPGDLILSPRQQVRLEGTGSGFDQIYWIDAIERHLHVARGFTQRVHARNATVGSQAASLTSTAH